MKRIALISPNMIGTLGGINRIQPGHGIMSIAAVLRKAGHQVYVRDTALEGYGTSEPLDDKFVLIGETPAEIRNWIAEVSPDYLGISIPFSNMLPHALTCAQIAKEVNPQIITLFGGSHVNCAVNGCLHYDDLTLLDFMQSNYVDFAIYGECEETIVAFLEAHDCPGLVYFNGYLHINKRSEPILDLDGLPVEAWDMMNMEKYFEIGLFHSPKGEHRVHNVMASRGCPHGCTFCTTSDLFGRRVRYRSAEKVCAEVQEHKKIYGTTEVQFDDDNLTANYAFLMRLCDGLKGLGVRWCTPNGIKINYHVRKQAEMFRMMVESGCYQVTFGVESGVQGVLDSIGKGLDLTIVMPTIEKATQAGLRVHVFFMVGFPGETRKQMEETVQFAAQTGADSFSLSIVTPLPGTAVFEKAHQENLWWKMPIHESDFLYTRSLLRVIGFENSEEFECWVDEKNLYLNQLLSENDLVRFAMIYGESPQRADFRKQT